MSEILLIDLVKKYNVNYHRVRKWILKGWIVGGKKDMVRTFVGKGNTERSIKFSMWWVDEDSFLKIPEFLRNKKNKKATNSN